MVPRRPTRRRVADTPRPSPIRQRRRAPAATVEHGALTCGASYPATGRTRHFAARCPVTSVGLVVLAADASCFSTVRSPSSICFGCSWTSFSVDLFEYEVAVVTGATVLAVVAAGMSSVAKAREAGQIAKGQLAAGNTATGQLRPPMEP